MRRDDFSSFLALSLSVSSEVLRSAKVSEALETSPVLFFDVRLGDVGVHRKELMGNCGSDFFLRTFVCGYRGFFVSRSDWFSLDFFKGKDITFLSTCLFSRWKSGFLMIRLS